jgi:CheY-like chemotaxis protein
VLINLFSNAIKYNRADGSVTCVISRVDSTARISIADTGRGIAPEDVARLFVPFERLDAQVRGIDGTGLGLALSRNLTEAMDGSLGVRSTPGEGSMFWVDLPVCEKPALQADPEPGDSIIAIKRYEGSRTILYVEDVVANVQLVEEVVKRRPGARLISAMLGGTGLEMAREHRPDLILLDLHLPDLNGTEVLRRLRADARTSRIPVVILSADATKRHLQDVMAAGAIAYLTKPVSVRRLLEVMDSTLARDMRKDSPIAN